MLELKSVSFSYGNTQVLTDISFSAVSGECIAVIGESGCGKSTMLKLIYGIYDVDSGSISLDGMPILGPKFNLLPGGDHVKYVAQDFDLMPFITCAENVGKFLSNTNIRAKQQKISELLNLVGMGASENVLAKTLSGGQQQRVALARAIASEPKLLILDEPFSQIDAFRRNELRRKLFRHFKTRGITCIVATHDSTDILSYSDKVVVLQHGKVKRSGSPGHIYNDPQSYYTASMFGEVSEIPSDIFYKGSGKILFLYPDQLIITDSGGISARVVSSFFEKNHFLVHAVSENGELFVSHHEFVAPGKKVFITLRSLGG